MQIQRTAVFEGNLAVESETITLDGAYFADELADVVGLERNEHGGIPRQSLGRVRITIEPASS